MAPIYYYDSVSSTNNLAKQLAEQACVNGTSLVADYQTEGRGRLGKNWYSVPGKGLYCSIVLRPKIAVESFPQITMVCGLALAKVLDEIVAKQSMLKWPNDIFFDGRKCAGILTEASPLNRPVEELYVIVGIGVNVQQTLPDFPNELQGKVTSLALLKKKTYHRKFIFLKIREKLLQYLEEFYQYGFDRVLTQWKEKDFLLHKRMECVSAGGKKISGIALGPDSEGLLHVQDDSGNIHEVLSGDVSLAV